VATPPYSKGADASTNPQAVAADVKLEILAPVRTLQASSIEWLTAIESVMRTAPYSYGVRVIYQQASPSSESAVQNIPCPLVAEKEQKALGIYGAINQAIDNTRGAYFLILGEGDTLTCHPDLRREGEIIVGSSIPFEPRIRLKLSEVCQQNVIYNTAWFRSHKLRFNTNLTANADHLLHMQMMRHHPCIRRIPVFSEYAGNGFSEHHSDRLYHAALPSLRRHYLGIPAMLSTLILRQLRRLLGRKQRYLSLAAESRIAVVIISNRPQHLQTCLARLSSTISRAGYRHKVTQIQVICDDHSEAMWDTEKLRRTISRCGVPTFIHLSSSLQNTSISQGTERSSLRNFAAALARHKDPLLTHFFFLDGDIEISMQTFRAIHNRLQTPWASIAFTHLPPPTMEKGGGYLPTGSYIEYCRSSAKQLLVQILRVTGWLPMPKKLYAPTACSGQLLIGKEIFDVAGEFQSMVKGWGGEDLALGYRLYQQGIYPIAPTIPLWPSRHHWHPTLSPAEKRHINQTCVALLREHFNASKRGQPQ